MDERLRERARAVIPGGMYGHQSTALLPAAYPQFMRGGRGARVWDVDGNEYVDLMCSYGPVVLGHQHPRVEAAVAAQAALADCQNAPGPVMVDLAELLRADRAARGLGDVRQERHRRHHHVLHDRPGADRAAQDPRRLRRLPRRGALVHAAAGRRHPAGPREPRLLHLQRPGKRPRRPPPRRATTWRASWSARSSTTPATTRSWSTPSSPAACARSATPPGPR